MMFFSSKFSPFTSAVIWRARSPRAAAIVTSAMLRTWPVRFEAIELTLSVRSFQVPATPSTAACPPGLPSGPPPPAPPAPRPPPARRLPAELSVGAHLARDAAHFARECVELVDHRVHRLLQLE